MLITLTLLAIFNVFVCILMYVLKVKCKHTYEDVKTITNYFSIVYVKKCTKCGRMSSKKNKYYLTNYL